MKLVKDNLPKSFIEGLIKDMDLEADLVKEEIGTLHSRYAHIVKYKYRGVDVLRIVKRTNKYYTIYSLDGKLTMDYALDKEFKTP